MIEVLVFEFLKKHWLDIVFFAILVYFIVYSPSPEGGNI